MSRRRAKTKSTTTFLIVLFFMFHVQVASEVQPMGSILFEDHGFPKRCFVQEDIALLSTRLKFQDLLPVEGKKSLMNDEKATAILTYFYGINKVILQNSAVEIRHLLLKSLYDLVGSYFKHQAFPIAKFSFYSGNISLLAVQDIQKLYEHSKHLLNTNGNNWKDPITIFSHLSVDIDRLVIPRAFDDESLRSCAHFMMNRNNDDSEEGMLLPLPKIDIEATEELSTIWLPFKRKTIFNVYSKSSAFIFLRYFVNVTQCYNAYGMNQGNFNRKLKFWIVQNVLPYLQDDKVYPAFGAILRVLETIKDPNEDDYVGTQTKHQKSQRHLPEEVNNLVTTKEEFDIEADSDIELWYRTGLVGCAVICIFFLVLFLMVRMCKNRDTVANETFDEKKTDRRTLTQKLLYCFKQNSHRNDPDEFYQYKKTSETPGARGVAFENEKKARKQKGKQNTKEKINLPLLGGASDSENEVFAKKPSSTSFKKGTFKISESSDNDSSCKNPSKGSLKQSQKPTDSKSSSTFFEKTQRFGKSQQRHPKSSDTR